MNPNGPHPQSGHKMYFTTRSSPGVRPSDEEDGGYADWLGAGVSGDFGWNGWIEFRRLPKPLCGRCSGRRLVGLLLSDAPEKERDGARLSDEGSGTFQVVFLEKDTLSNCIGPLNTQNARTGPIVLPSAPGKRFWIALSKANIFVEA